MLSDEEARLYVKQVMEQNKFRPKRSMLMSRRWYDKIGKEKKPTSILAALPFRTRLIVSADRASFQVQLLAPFAAIRVRRRDERESAMRALILGP